MNATNALSPVEIRKYEQLPVHIHPTIASLAGEVASTVHGLLSSLLAQKKDVRVILATGNSQIRMLEELTRRGGIDWKRITFFHMDEYLGISANHPASFRRYLRERVEEKVHPKAFHYIDGECLEPFKECQRYETLLREDVIDLCCLGIGENGHLAFNDPPVASFEEKELAKVVQLDESCKLQQVREGHFPNLGSVPPYAITLTIAALCRAARMLCVAPETRKAAAVKAALEGPISTACPASILRRQSHATLFLDKDSAALLAK